MLEITLKVNGQEHQLQIEPRELLADVLRDRLSLTGTHVGCDTSQCGCCTVLVDGNTVKACTMLAIQANGTSITTIEGLADGEIQLPWSAMRVLHYRNDYGDGGFAGKQSKARH